MNEINFCGIIVAVFDMLCMVFSTILYYVAGNQLPYSYYRLNGVVIGAMTITAIFMVAYKPSQKEN